MDGPKSQKGLLGTAFKKLTVLYLHRALCVFDEKQNEMFHSSKRNSANSYS